MVKFWYVQHNINLGYFCKFYEANTWKYINIESAVKLNIKKVFLLHEQLNTHSETFTPLVCSIISDALLKAMPQCR